MMKLLRRPLSLLFSASFSTVLPVPSPSLTFLQSLLNQIKHLSANPKHYPSLTTLDSLLTNTHMLNPATSLIIIDYLTQINKLSRAKTLISHLNSSGTTFVGLIFMDGGSYCLERQSYVALSAALCSLNEGILAKKVVNEMYDKGMVVDNWTYFSMFRCFCRNGDFDEADLALRKLVKNGFVVDICVYGSWIDGLCKYGKYREADKLFRKFLKRGSVKKFGEEKKVLKEGRRAIFQLNCEGVVPELMAYECYFRALCNAMKLDDAEVLLKKMISGRALPETCVYGSFIKALFRSGRDEDAMKFFKVQRKKGLVRVDEIVTYVIMGLCENGKSDDALRLFDEILTVNGFVNGSYVCNIILGGYWKHDGVSKAELFFERWRSNEVRYGKLDVTSYTIMCNGYCSGNDVRKAVMVFEEMLKRKMTVNGALYERVIRLLCDCGRANEAFRYFNDMIENGHLVFCKRWRTIFQSVFSIEGHHVSIGC
ncbi:putative tetratricopeptide-like helical domain superfamily [Helianthus annuus]|nr:putative tetratricopeptide-like helical domain superfamily [Helianthus annuus]